MKQKDKQLMIYGISSAILGLILFCIGNYIFNYIIGAIFVLLGAAMLIVNSKKVQDKNREPTQIDYSEKAQLASGDIAEISRECQELITKIDKTTDIDESLSRLTTKLEELNKELDSIETTSDNLKDISEKLDELLIKYKLVKSNLTKLLK